MSRYNNKRRKNDEAVVKPEPIETNEIAVPFEPEEITPFVPRKLMEDYRKSAGKKTGLSAVEEAACVQLLPGYMESDGFFFARFRRRGQ